MMKSPKEIYKILLDLFPGINEYLPEGRKIQIVDECNKMKIPCKFGVYRAFFSSVVIPPEKCRTFLLKITRNCNPECSRSVNFHDNLIRDGKLSDRFIRETGFHFNPAIGTNRLFEYRFE